MGHNYYLMITHVAEFLRCVALLRICAASAMVAAASLAISWHRRRCSGLGKFLRQLRVLAMRNRFKEKLNFKLHLELATPLGHSVVGAYG